MSFSLSPQLKKSKIAYASMKSIFVSSTYTDLQKERKAAIEILDREHHAVAMEKFFAENHQATEVCLKKLQQCDGIVLIVGERYGSVDPKEHVSITEIEYTTAKALGLPIFALIKTRSDGSWQSNESDPDRVQKHHAFKKRVDDEKYRREFQTPDQLKTEILGAITNCERTHGELGVRVSAFVTGDRFFKAFADPTRLFNHCWTLVGRTETIDKLNFFVRSPKRVAIISGRGTIGKTKILFEFSRIFPSEHPEKHVLFLREGVPLDHESIKQIPAQPTIIVVDDAHRRADLKFILQVSQQYPERIKLIFSARPQGKEFMKTALAETGFGTSEVEDLGELKDLSRAELKQLAAQVLGQSNAHLADQLVAATGDSPLVTLVGAQLLVNHAIDPLLLERHEEFQFAVLSRFEDAITGKISPKVDAQLGQRVLALISILAPIRPHDPHFQEVAAEFLNIEKRTLVDVVGAFEEQGVLLRRGYSLRITPDVLSDHILHKTCLTESGQPTGFAEDVFQQFAKIAADRVLVNLAELDWRIGKTVGKSPLFDRIWEDINRSFRKGSNYERSVILEWLGKIAYYQPSRALALVEFAIRHPSKQSGNNNLQALFKLTHSDILRALPKVIQAIGYNVDFLPRCCDLLWELGRDDNQRPNSNPDSPMRILLEFAKYDIGKPSYVNQIVLDAAEKWLKESGCHNHLNSPLDILDVLLEKEGLSWRSEGINVMLRSFPVSPKNTNKLRQRAIKLIEECAQSASIRVRIRSLHSLSEALRSPHGSLGRSVTTEEQKHWTRERRQILDVISSIAASHKAPIAHLRITRDLRWYAKHASPTALRERTKSIIQSIPETFDYLLNKALWYNSWDWEDDLDDKSSGDHVKRAQETEKKLRLIVKKFLRKYPKPDRGFRILSECVEKLERAGIAPNPGYFLNVLSRTNPTYAAKICRLLLRRPGCNLAAYMASLLSSVRRDKPLVAKNIINKAIESKDETLSVAVGQFYNWGEDNDKGDLIAIKKLLKHTSLRVKKIAVHALTSFKEKWHRNVIEVIKTIKVSKNTDLAEDI